MLLRSVALLIREKMAVALNFFCCDLQSVIDGPWVRRFPVRLLSLFSANPANILRALRALEPFLAIRGNVGIKTPEPPRHGRVIAGAPGKMVAKHLRKHLADLTAHANEVKDYGCHGTGFSSQGAMSPGAAQGADYQTVSVNDTPDSDSTGPTRY